VILTQLGEYYSSNPNFLYLYIPIFICLFIRCWFGETFCFWFIKQRKLFFSQKKESVMDGDDKMEQYTDNLLLVGITYNRDNKQHQCHIERYV